MRSITVIAAAALVLAIAAAAGHVPLAEAAGQGSTQNMKAKPKVKKGVIFIRTKRFSSCSDWGRDKGWCAKHNTP
jgi:hypothetical protein